jgi:hypothetical protein
MARPVRPFTMRCQDCSGAKRLSRSVMSCHPRHQRGVHTTELGAPLVEGCGADAMLTTQLRRRTAGLGLLEYGDDLAV